MASKLLVNKADYSMNWSQYFAYLLSEHSRQAFTHPFQAFVRIIKWSSWKKSLMKTLREYDYTVYMILVEIELV